MILPNDINEGAGAVAPATSCSAAEDAARQSKICICGKPMNQGVKPPHEGGPVCWHCFKHRTDVTPYKYFQGSYDEWVKCLPNDKIQP